MGVLEHDFFIYYTSGKAYENNSNNQEGTAGSIEAECKKELNMYKEKLPCSKK
jgi:hypothetical protein